jgi:hypothetical protein
MFSSYILATQIKTKYHRIRAHLYFLSNFHLFKCVATTKNMIVENNETVEYTIPKKRILNDARVNL